MLLKAFIIRVHLDLITANRGFGTYTSFGVCASTIITYHQQTLKKIAKSIRVEKSGARIIMFVRDDSKRLNINSLIKCQLTCSL